MCEAKLFYPIDVTELYRLISGFHDSLSQYRCMVLSFPVWEENTVGRELVVQQND